MPDIVQRIRLRCCRNAGGREDFHTDGRRTPGDTEGSRGEKAG